MQAIALADFEGTEDGQKSFASGAPLTILNVNTPVPGWWEALVASTVAWVPESYVQLISPPHWPADATVVTVTALQAFKAPSKAYLPLRQGQVVTLLRERTPGWFEGVSRDRRGLVAQSHVSELGGEELSRLQDVPVIHPRGERSPWREDPVLADLEAATKAATSDGPAAVKPRATAARARRAATLSRKPMHRVARRQSQPDLQSLLAHTSRNHLSPFLELLFEGEMPLLKALCVAATPRDADETCPPLQRIGARYGLTYRIMECLVAAETKRQYRSKAGDGTLFRSNNLATFFLTRLANAAGSTYLMHVLGPCVAAVSKLEHSVEVDPNRLAKGERVKQNAKRLRRIVLSVMQKITRSMSMVPDAIRRVCQHLRQVVMANAPSAKYSVIGGFFFLRFINPALVGPVRAGLTTSNPNSVQLRALILTSKVLQVMANDRQMERKEGWMEHMQSFITEQQKAMFKFFDAMVQSPASTASEARVDPLHSLVSDASLESDETHLKDFVRRNREAVEQYLQQEEGDEACKAVVRRLPAALSGSRDTGPHRRTTGTRRKRRRRKRPSLKEVSTTMEGKGTDRDSKAEANPDVAHGE